MLYKVEIENFYSIGERQVIDLRARKSVRDELGRLSPIYEGSEERVPNVVTLFGPNASGKSNVLRAIIFSLDFRANSFDKRIDLPLPYEKFNNSKKIASPSKLALSFSAYADFQNISGEGLLCPYTYELVLSPRGEKKPEHVVLEKMSYKPRGHGKPTTIFERKENKITKCAKGFMTTQIKNLLEQVLRDNASVISTLAQLNHTVAEHWSRSINSQSHNNIFISRFEDDDDLTVHRYESHPQVLLEQLKEIARRIDFGIEDVTIDKSNSKSQLQFQHSGLDYPISFERESHGTRQVIKELPYIFAALATGGIAVIDDFDAAIHPLILLEILRWFNSKEHNPRGAQLWMTCHSTTLLRELTKEEVLLCEKDAQGHTSVYGLADIEGVRREEDFFGKYLSGEYGAVPTIG